jgi:hypothetical protein
MHVRQAAVDAVVAVGELGVVDAEEVQDGGVEVVAAGGILGGFVGPFVARAVASGKPPPGWILVAGFWVRQVRRGSNHVALSRRKD